MPGRLLDVLAPILGPRQQHLLELSLPDDRVQRPADPRLRQQLLDVHQPDDLAADPVLGVAAAEDRPADLDLASSGPGSCPAVLSITSLTSAMPSAGRDGRAGEDDVGHLAAAQRARALLAERPADRVDQVGLARPVGADDHGHAGDELEDGLVREAT